MQINDALLDKLAALSKLEIPDEERVQLKMDFQRMLDFVTHLQGLNTEGVVPLIHMTEEVNRLRPDQAQDALPLARVLENAPQAEASFFQVPNMMKK